MWGSFYKLLQTFKKLNKNFNFSNYCKAHQYIRDFKISGHFVIQGRRNRDSKSGYKNCFKEEFFSKHKVFQTIAGHNKIGIW